MVKLNNKLVVAALLVFAGGSLAMPMDQCSCNSGNIKLTSCQTNEVQSPTWWGWLTSNKSSQLHFFQLVELLHTHDVEVKTNSALIAQKEDKSI